MFEATEIIVSLYFAGVFFAMGLILAADAGLGYKELFLSILLCFLSWFFAGFGIGLILEKARQDKIESSKRIREQAAKICEEAQDRAGLKYPHIVQAIREMKID